MMACTIAIDLLRSLERRAERERERKMSSGRSLIHRVAKKEKQKVRE